MARPISFGWLLVYSDMHTILKLTPLTALLLCDYGQVEWVALRKGLLCSSYIIEMGSGEVKGTTLMTLTFPLLHHLMSVRVGWCYTESAWHTPWAILLFPSQLSEEFVLLHLFVLRLGSG